MNRPLDEYYFEWLYEQVGNLGRVKRLTHRSLLWHMYKTPFIWMVPNDDNRVEDGRALRYQFIELARIEADAHWLGMECSVLEMLIALSQRLAFEAEGEPRDWFWVLLRNMHLEVFSDAHYEPYTSEVEAKLSALVFRTYQSNGEGGLFPLQYPEEDQRQVEIWYQMSGYLAELEC